MSDTNELRSPQAGGDTPMGEWCVYAKMVGLLDDDGIATDRTRAQTAWTAFTYAWNRALELKELAAPTAPAAGPQQGGAFCNYVGAVCASNCDPGQCVERVEPEVPHLYQHALSELQNLGYAVEDGELMPPATGIPVPQRPAQAISPQQGDVPDGYMLVMVPEIQPQDEPDWDECIRQAEVATGLKVERNTLSIVIREVRRWLAGRAAGPQQSTEAWIAETMAGPPPDHPAWEAGPQQGEAGLKWVALPFASPIELWKAFKAGAKFVLHYHGKALQVERMEPREHVVYVQPPWMPVKVYPDGRNCESAGDAIWLEQIANEPAPAVERGVAAAIDAAESEALNAVGYVGAANYAERQRTAMQLVRDAFRSVRAALTATTSPSDTELAAHEEMGAVAMRDDGRLDADNWLPNGDVPAELADGWRWVDAKRVLILSPTLTATGAAQGDGASYRPCAVRDGRCQTGNACQELCACDPHPTKQEAPAAQPLTPEAIRNLWVEHGCDGEDAESFARAIERAHGIQPAATKGTT